MNYSIEQIAQIVQGKLLLNETKGAAIEHLLIDSRKLLFPSTSIFFSLGGPRRNGQAFIQELYDKGVRSFIAGKDFDMAILEHCPNANIIQVQDVLTSLHALAAHHRMQFDIPVIGITGSNGKTIVKEWLYQILHHDYNIVRSPKSYNSQIGVPLSVWQMNAQHTLAIFEAGISMPQEMQRLQKIIRPSIGVFTNIGDAHNEGFLNIQEKINEKLRLFTQSDLLIYGDDNPVLSGCIKAFVQNTSTTKSNEVEKFTSRKLVACFTKPMKKLIQHNLLMC